MRGKRVFEFLVVLALVALGVGFYTKQQSVPEEAQCPPFSITVNGVGLGDTREQVEQVLGSPSSTHNSNLESYDGDIEIGYQDSVVVGVSGWKVESEGVDLFEVGDDIEEAARVFSGSDEVTEWRNGELKVYRNALYGLIVLTTPEGTITSISVDKPLIPPRKPLGPRTDRKLLYFYAKTAKWCHRMEPILDAYARNNGLELIKVEAVPGNSDLRRYGSYYAKAPGNVPFTVLLDKDGKVLESFVGYESYEDIEAKLGR